MEEENNGFGMTSEDVQNYQRNVFWGRIKYYFLSIEPAVAKILNALVYYTLRFIKALVSTSIRMILGKEI